MKGGFVYRFIIFSILFLFACAGERKIEKVEIKPPEITIPPLPSLEKEKRIVIEGPKEVFSFVMRDADIRDVLRAIGRQINYNVVIEPDVAGRCTIEIKNVTLSKALEYILEPLNYTYKIEDRTIYVSKPKIETKVFPVNYVAIKKRGLSSIKGTTGTERTAKEEIVRVESETESDIFKTLEGNIKELLSPDGKFILNKEASILIVMDYPKNIKNVGLYLEAIQGSVTKQVMIETKIVEVELNERSKEGVNWSYIMGKWDELTLNIEQVLVAPQTKYFNIPKVEEAKLPAPPTQYLRFGVLSGKKFEAFIDLLKTQGNINVISSPKIATLNNQRAVIKVATEDVFFEATTTVTAGAPPTTSVTPRYVTIGLILDVIPHIDSDGNITMNIHPVLTEKVGEAKSGETGTVITAPILAVREVDTVIKVKEGESVIIGGLIKDKKVEEETGLKGPMNLPIFGSLFKTKVAESIRTELVIFLTPKIIYE